MRILVTAVPVMLGWLVAMPALALDDTPTQTPYLSSKADDSRAVTPRAPAAPAAVLRRVDLDDSRRQPRTPVVQTAVAAPPAVAATPAPLAPALPAVGRGPALAGRAIGLR